MFRLMSGILAREARRLGVRFVRAPRGIMLYGRDVPEWSGQFLAWLLPHLGAISVYPGRLHSESIATIRRCLTDSPYPVVLAPEGQVTYHNERVAALEQGTAQLAFWCVEDLKKQSRTEDVVILPVCTSYHYDPRGWPPLLRLLAQLERSCGLPDVEGLTPSSGRDVRNPPSEEDRAKIVVRVTRVTRRLADLAEEYYARFYGTRFPAGSGDESPEDLQARLHRICEAALAVVEARFQVSPKGDFVQRVLAVRAAGSSASAVRTSPTSSRSPRWSGAWPIVSRRRRGSPCVTWSSSTSSSTSARTTSLPTRRSTGSWKPSRTSGTSRTVCRGATYRAGPILSRRRRVSS